MAWHLHVTPVLVADFDKAASAELVGDADNSQARAAVEAAKTLVAAGLAGSAAVNLVAAGQEEDSARGGHPFLQITVSQFDSVDAPQSVEQIKAADDAKQAVSDMEAMQQAVDTKLKEDTLAVADGKANADTLADEPLADVVKPTPPTDFQYQADSNVEPTA